MYKLIQFRLLAILVLLHSTALNAGIGLVDWGLNSNGTTYCGELGDGCDFDGEASLASVFEVGSFDFNTGLGSISSTFSGAGNYTLLAFFDHEIDQATNGFDNEFGNSSNTPVAGQSWEIDEPGFLFGDIFDNFFISAYDNSNNVPQGIEDDVAIGLGWDINLAADETAIISFLLSSIEPTDGFFLSHVDLDSNQAIYFSSTFEKQTVPDRVPIPAPIWLFGSSLLLLSRKLTFK